MKNADIGECRKAVRRRLARYRSVLLQTLEPRELFAADLSGSFLSAPGAALAGSTQSVTINVANSGTTRASGSMIVAYYAAVDGDPFDPNTATLLRRVRHSIAITGGGSASITDSVPVSVSLGAGTYRIYAVLDADHTVSETDESNNTAQSAAVAIAQPDYDLVPSIDPKTSLPPSILLGKKRNATVRVTIENSSGATATLPAGLTVQVQVVARPTAGPDVPLNTKVINASVSRLAPGQSRTVSIAIQFPDTLPADTYQIVAIVDTGGALAETDEANNEALFGNPLVVGGPFADPAVAFDPTSIFPSGVVADGRAVPVKIDITNLGNTRIAAGQTASIAFFAHNIGTSTDTPLESFTISLSNLAAAATKVFTLKPTIPNTLAIGNYEFRAELTTTAAGDVVGNNSASSNTPFAVGPAFFNLAAQPPISGFNPAILRATKTSDTVDVPVKNLSNTLIPAGTLADVTVSLRRINATSSANDILIGTAPNVSFSNLAQGATKIVHVSSRIPDRLPGNIPVPDAEYEFVATVTPATLVESTLADNTAVGSDIIIGGPFVDLAVVSATHNFRTPAASGSTGIGTVRLRNTGNVLIQGPVNIQFFISTDANPTGIFLGSQTFTLILAPGAISPPISAALGLNVSGGGLAAVEGDIVARINPASFADANVANDSLDAGHVVISSQFVDLRVASATNPFSSTVLGNSTGSGQVLLVNIGSGISVGDVVVKYFATPTGTLNGSEILIGSKTVGISLLSAQLTPAISVDLALPNPAILTNYKIVATITAPAATDNNPNDNLTTILGSVNVLPV